MKKERWVMYNSKPYAFLKRKGLAFFALFILLVTCTLALYTENAVAYEVSTVNYRLLADTQTVNNQTGYVLRDASLGAGASAVQTVAGTHTVTFAYRVWVCSLNDIDLIVDLTDFAIRNSAGEGYQNASASVNEYMLSAGYNNLRVGIFVSFSGGSYLPVAYFVGDQIIEKKINAETWTLQLYTESVQNASGTYAYAYWGDSLADSRLFNVEYTDLLPQEHGLIQMATGDWIYGVIFPYAFLIGYPIMWGVCMLFLGNMVYGRYRRFEPVLIMLLLFGGSGGLGMLIPEAGYRLLYLIVIFVTTVVLYRLFR
jgi:hypothetical protein